MQLLRIAFASFSILLAGCWPYRYTRLPGISGVVVSASDGTPVAAAQVILIAPLWSQEGRRITARTDDDGRFDLAAERRWGMLVVMQEPFRPVKCSVEIAAPNFLLESVPLQCSEMGPVTTDLGKVKLRRQP